MLVTMINDEERESELEGVGVRETLQKATREEAMVRVVSAASCEDMEAAALTKSARSFSNLA
ncbi:hypothetical protein E2C01_079294 [Portunus trituberculatus]|uniref:Uncharacterized protein n=1 Tax=Portunus trituberculatus TaxID=210409 RepID=A0A5B7IWI8_PORTR|nr:hypothetical protein [Portunus trituberculatus]